MVDDGRPLDCPQGAVGRGHVGGQPHDALRGVAAAGAVDEAYGVAAGGEFGGEGGAGGTGAEDDVRAVLLVRGHEGSPLRSGPVGS